MIVHFSLKSFLRELDTYATFVNRETGENQNAVFQIMRCHAFGVLKTSAFRVLTNSKVAVVW